MITLSSDQKIAVDTFLEFMKDDSQHEMVLAGHSGSGKSTITHYMMQALDKANEIESLITRQPVLFSPKYFTATTNKASKVLSDMLNYPTQTIHSFLHLKVKNDFKTGKTVLIENKKQPFYIVNDALVLIDEASMIDEELLAVIRKKLKKCKVVFIGDPYQLPPVMSDTCPVFDTVKNQVHLSTIHRQAENSPIISLGELFRQSVITGDTVKISATEPSIYYAKGSEFQQMMDDSFSANKYNAGHSKVLAWSNQRVHQYNDYIRELLGNTGPYVVGEYLITNKPILQGASIVFPTDSVVQITNISGGKQVDLLGWHVELNGHVNAFIPKNKWEVSTLVKQYSKNKDWHNYFETQEIFADLRPIHASTIHKAQGSTHNTVFIDLSDIGKNSDKNEVARLLYVAATRASEQVVFSGSLPE